MQFNELVQTSAAVAATSSRLEKVSKLATLLKRVPLDEVATAIVERLVPDAILESATSGEWVDVPALAPVVLT